MCLLGVSEWVGWMGDGGQGGGEGRSNCISGGLQGTAAEPPVHGHRCLFAERTGRQPKPQRDSGERQHKRTLTLPRRR